MRSIEHDTLGMMALTWMGARCGSFRGACEVQITDGFVADAACVSVMYHSEFIRRCMGWGITPLTFTYSWNDGNKSRDEKGDIPDYFASVFEAKATRADFLSTFGGRDNDHKNRLEPVANLHWIVTEKNVCAADEVPGHWGLLVRRGRGLSEMKPAAYHPADQFQVLRIESRLLWKPARGAGVLLPCCSNCNGPLDDRVRFHWSAKEPAHLMDDNPDDDGLDRCGRKVGAA